VWVRVFRCFLSLSLVSPVSWITATQTAPDLAHERITLTCFPRELDTATCRRTEFAIRWSYLSLVYPVSWILKSLSHLFPP
jgi:hypothetical protein